MKKLLTLFALMLTCASAAAEIVRMDLDSLSGTTLQGSSDRTHISIQNSVFEKPGFMAREYFAFFNFEEVSITQQLDLEVSLYGNPAMWVNLRDGKTTYNQFGYGNWKDPDLQLGYDVEDYWVLNFGFADFGKAAGESDFMTFGEGSYILVTDTLGEIIVPETGTFALFLAGAIGLCVRRQIKQQA